MLECILSVPSTTTTLSWILHACFSWGWIFASRQLFLSMPLYVCVRAHVCMCAWQRERVREWESESLLWQVGLDNAAHIFWKTFEINMDYSPHLYERLQSGSGPIFRGSLSQRKPIHARGEHANVTQEGQGLPETFPTRNLFWFFFYLTVGGQ